ncbi:retrovirus-related pol polyprotein from transposon TNT 1-94 [Tanacetum coccineum]|uniref:Retrovirus-related pol polyprotein from transposon TNT 1-94 n=1 Tax=Tanacetum coccineum TaxID=301880 RepID=A0ABQ5C8U9_9ASTR
MKDNFEMSMIGEMKFFLRLQVDQSPLGIFICQSQYTMDILKKHGMEKCDTVSTPMATIKLDADLQGTLVTKVNVSKARPTEKHRKEVKRIFRYLRQSINMGLWYLKDYGFELIAYADADNAGCNDDFKSTSRGIQFLGDELSSCSVEKQDVQLCPSRKLSILAISCNPVKYSRTKHINIRYHFIKEHVEKGTIELYFVGTEYQLAALFTKALPKERLRFL